MTLSAAAQTQIERPELEIAFREKGVTGTFVLYDVTNQRLISSDLERANKRFIPASTFKIVNSLIALELQVIADENEVIPYGGARQFRKEWEKDMSIRDSIRISNLPVFRELARRIGIDRYKAALADLPYGNAKVGGDVEQFWLRGPLTISAMEHAHILARLATQTLPASPQNQAIVRDILRLETRGTATLYGKTGWTTKPVPDIGWFVGWVEQGDDIYAFALNLDIHSKADLPKRIGIAKQLLSELGAY